jgi:L-tartrate/succinate antiporter
MRPIRGTAGTGNDVGGQGGAGATGGRPASRDTRWRVLVPIGAGAALAVLPVPAGLTPSAWHYFALFAAVVIGLVLEPVPAAGVGFIGMAVAAATRLAAPDPADSLKIALSGFANGTVWLVFSAFMLSLGYERTGLGKRIALQLVRRLGGSTLGLGYAVMFSDLALAPFTPSNTARSAGTIFPIIRNIPSLYGSEPGPTARRIGGYVIYTAFAATAVTSSMFPTALAPNLLALGLVADTIGYRFSMGEWLVGFLPVGLVLVLALPWFIYKIYPPSITDSTEVRGWAVAELREMGGVSRGEITMACLALLAVGLWIFGAAVMEAATVALVVISLMLLLGVVSWQEVTAHKDAWNVLALLATLFGLADGLNKVGFVAWFAKGSAAALIGLPPAAVMAALVAVFFLVHYMFASITAHVAAVLPVVLAAGAAVPGMPVKPFALLLCYSLGVMGILTPYATGPAPVFYASGYVSRKAFWTLGLVLGLVFLTALLVIGVPSLLFLERF